VLLAVPDNVIASNIYRSVDFCAVVKIVAKILDNDEKKSYVINRAKQVDEQQRSLE